MNNDQAIQRVVKSAEVDRDEALFALKKTVKALSDWEPPEVTAELLADRVVSGFRPDLVDDEFRETCLCAARVALDAIST